MKTESDLRTIVLKSFKVEMPSISQVNLEDSFKSLNLDSLSRTMVVFRIEEELKKDFSELNLFNCDSLEEICQKIESQKK